MNGTRLNTKLPIYSRKDIVAFKHVIMFVDKTGNDIIHYSCSSINHNFTKHLKKTHFCSKKRNF